MANRGCTIFGVFFGYNGKLELSLLCRRGEVVKATYLTGENEMLQRKVGAEFVVSGLTDASRKKLNSVKS
jgi:hypothetical protein